MTAKDLKKVESFLERYEKLPKNADLKIKIMFDNPTQADKDEAKIILDEINSLFIDIVAFVKVKFGKDSSYIRLSNSIDFNTEIRGIPIHNNDRAAINRSWSDGMSRLENMLNNLKAEVKEILEDEPDTLSIYREKEKKTLKIKGTIVLWVLCYCIPIAIALFFAFKIRNTVDFDWKDVMTWINPNEFGKIEFLLILVEAIILAICSYFYQRHKEDFIQKYYDRYRIKSI